MVYPATDCKTKLHLKAKLQVINGQPNAAVYCLFRRSIETGPQSTGLKFPRQSSKKASTNASNFSRDLAV